MKYANSWEGKSAVTSWYKIDCAVNQPSNHPKHCVKPQWTFISPSLHMCVQNALLGGDTHTHIVTITGTVLTLTDFPSWQKALTSSYYKSVTNVNVPFRRKRSFVGWVWYLKQEWLGRVPCRPVRLKESHLCRMRLKPAVCHAYITSNTVLHAPYMQMFRNQNRDK